MTKAPQGRGRAGVSSGNLRAAVFCPLPEPDQWTPSSFGGECPQTPREYSETAMGSWS